MIHPRELRIGNYVSIPDRGKIEPHYITTKITQILHNEVKTEYHKYTDSCLCINPIPLTEDILLNCGFESVECDGERYNPDDEYKNSFTYRLDVGIFYRDLICKPALGWYVFIQNSDLERKWDLRSKDIYFLHELQNLYFAITGQELEVQL